MEPPPQLANGAADPVELQPPSIDGVSDEMESVVPSVQVLATDLTSEIDRSPDQNKSSGEIETVVSSAQDSATELTSEVKQSPESKKSSAEMSNSVEKEKSTTVVMSAGIGKHSQMQNCTDKSNGETEASMIKQSLENGSKIEQSPDNNVPSAQIENSAETKKAAAEKFGRELSDLMLRLDPSGAVTLMLLASPLYAVLAVLPLWLFADQPQAFLWTFAHLTCLYLFLWIITVSTESVSTVFVRVTYVLMLAFTVVHLIGPMNGMLFLYTGMVYLAGTLGYAVAEHFQRAGFEKTANALCSSPSNSKKYEEKVSMMHAVTVLMSLPILARMACLFLVPYSGHMSQMDVLHLMVELTAEMFAVAVLWIIYITEFILRGALVSMERFLWNAFTSCIACYLLVILLSFKFAEAVGMLVMWLEWMAIGGFFGYCLAVRAFYCKMLASDESGFYG